ncbi:zinc-binding alcohol dehydrogenase family protein [Undibacterium arcticum]|uniref:Zinc-binding alcohol dehydrogenase family protein n=1 Tax=Undibacterium arcticum TaxID=1762892 RepID=A0ABV7EV31_9BURK
MRAIVIHRFGGPEELQLAEVATPEPGAGEVLIRVVLAGVNPADWKCREGRLQHYFNYQFPFIVGFDAAGVVERVGESVTEYAVGDTVLTSSNQGRGEWGSYAEYVKSSTANVARLPKGIDFAQGATIPTAGATAWGAVHDVGAVKAGQKVLINGGSSSVGIFAIQLAKAAGCEVAATCGPANLDFVKSLGADHVINYRSEAVLEATAAWAPEGVDLLVDAIGLSSLPADSTRVIRPGGALVAIATLIQDIGGFDAALAKSRDVRLLSNMAAAARIPEHLRAVVDAVAQGRVTTPPYEILPLEQAGEAHRRVADGHVRGKLLLRVGAG